MKELRTQMKQLSTQVSSSKFFLSVRKYTIERSLVQLSEDIEFVYNDVTSNYNYNLSRYELADIQQKILSGFYILSPLEVQYISKEYINMYIYLMRTEIPDFMVLHNKDPKLFTVVLPDKKDVLVFMGLSIMLYRLSHGCLPKDGYRMINLLDQFYDSIREMGKVDRLYSLKLDKSLLILTKSLILDKVKSLVGEGSVCYNLISSFLNLTAMDKDGKTVRIEGCIPIVGDISKVLFDIVLMDFDREFAKRFPGIAFTRHVCLVYISSKGDDEVLFDEKALYELLEELSLAGELASIGPGDDIIQCNTKQIYLDNDSKVVVE
jgi:hypothetical protein